MGASCIVQGWKPIREDDVITKVRYEKYLGETNGTVRVYYKSHLYDDEREYDCVQRYIWGSHAEDYVKFVVPIINTAPTHGSRYIAEWVVSNKSSKNPVNAKKNAAIAKEKSTNAGNNDTQLSFF